MLIYLLIIFCKFICLLIYSQESKKKINEKKSIFSSLLLITETKLMLRITLFINIIIIIENYIFFYLLCGKEIFLFVCFYDKKGKTQEAAYGYLFHLEHKE